MFYVGFNFMASNGQVRSKVVIVLAHLFDSAKLEQRSPKEAKDLSARNLRFNHYSR